MMGRRTITAIAAYVICAACLAAPNIARAERLILAPTGRIVLPSHAAALYLWRDQGKGQLGRLSLGVPKDDLGLELEVEHFGSVSGNVQTLGAQYSIISEAFTNNMAPAISVGVLDLPNRSMFGRSWYLSLSKTLGLSAAQERYLGLLRIHGGYGSHRMGGAYIGASVQIARRLDVAAELYARRLNESACLLVAGPLALVGQSHGGRGWLGAELRFARE